MKTIEIPQLSLGDHVRVIYTVRGNATDIFGAFLKMSESALHILSSKDPAKEPTRIAHTVVQGVEIVKSAPHAIFEQSKQRFEYGMRVWAFRNGTRFVGEVVAAWKEAVVIRQDPKKDGEVLLYGFHASELHRIFR